MHHDNGESCPPCQGRNASRRAWKTLDEMVKFIKYWVGVVRVVVPGLGSRGFGAGGGGRTIGKRSSCSDQRKEMSDLANLDKFPVAILRGVKYTLSNHIVKACLPGRLVKLMERGAVTIELFAMVNGR